MRSIILLSLLFFTFVAGCNSVENDFNLYCNKNIKFLIEKPIMNDFEVCYHNQGLIEMLILNMGNKKIDGFDIIIAGDNHTVNTRQMVIIDTKDGHYFTIYFPMKKMGKIRSVKVTPVINYNDEIKECWGSALLFRNVHACF